MSILAGPEDAVPVISVDPASNSFGVGTTVTLRCEAEGFPAPTYAWFLGGMELLEPRTSTLTFDLDPEKRGEYYCVATNPLGSDQSDSALITINGTTIDLSRCLCSRPELVLLFWGGFCWCLLINFMSLV